MVQVLHFMFNNIGMIEYIRINDLSVHTLSVSKYNLSI